ncbi:hypothetical protein ACFWPQ_46075 [Streptomyces sp. NPDC058464]|uniref:hypothetical protein n=1 Tax=Streptomyces sp. NPDC058464 TaxID=3346511 RepID=UPI003652E0FD
MPATSVCRRPTWSTSSQPTVNLIRLDVWCNGHPLNRTRINRLARLELSLTA